MEWINQKDKLPEIGESVLLWVVCKNQPLWTTYKFGHWENGKWYLVGGTQYGELEINFWQPLPEPPSKDLLSLCRVSNSADVNEDKGHGICVEDGCEKYAVVDYNGHGHWNCQRCYDKNERYFEANFD